MFHLEVWLVTPCRVVVGYQFLRGLHIHPEDGGSMDLRNVGILQQKYSTEDLDLKHHHHESLKTFNCCVVPNCVGIYVPRYLPYPFSEMQGRPWTK